MPSYEFVTVDVFTDQLFGGNPLAVLPDARGLTDAQMQAIAAEFNLSETTFVLPPQDPAHTAEVRIFTPRHELPFAGHPNVGTGYVLARRMAEGVKRLVFEEQAGLVNVSLLHDAAGGVAGAAISAPRSLQIGIEIPVETIAACASLDVADIAETAHTPLVASVGTDFVIAELASMDALRRATPDLAAMRDAQHRQPSDEPLPLGLLLYVRQDGDATRLATRMFAPLGGIMEDPATGSANAALAALLTSLAPGDAVDLAFDIVQGVEMGRPSRILGRARKAAEGPVTAHVEGNCVPVMRGYIDV
jgi:trans-2,3-dihydro-3-hydroxyanthranilate isomerase